MMLKIRSKSAEKAVTRRNRSPQARVKPENAPGMVLTSLFSTRMPIRKVIFEVPIMCDTAPTEVYFADILIARSWPQYLMGQ